MTTLTWPRETTQEKLRAAFNDRTFTPAEACAALVETPTQTRECLALAVRLGYLQRRAGRYWLVARHS